MTNIFVTMVGLKADSTAEALNEKNLSFIRYSQAKAGQFLAKYILHVKMV